MTKLKRAADKVAQSMVDEGIAVTEIGLLMSQKTHERLLHVERNGPDDVLAQIADGAALMPNLGMVAAGPLLDFLNGMPKMDLAAALKNALGADDEEAHALAADVAAGGMVLVGSRGRVEGTAPADAEETATQLVSATGVAREVGAPVDDEAGDDSDDDDEVDENAVTQRFQVGSPPSSPPTSR